MSKKNKKTLIRIIISLVLFAAAWIFTEAVKLPFPADLIIFAAIYLLIGWDVLYRAGRNISHGQIFDENFLMVVATLGAFGSSDYREAVAVMLFYQVGELFQSVAVGKARRSVSSLMQLRPDTAHRLLEDGTQEDILPEEIAEGDLLIVKPGERIAADSTVCEGYSCLDTAALTGESAPVDAAPGDALLSGSVNLTSVLKIRARKPYGQSTAARILDLVENASAKKARAENFITRFARWYTPAVCLCALLLATVPLLVTGRWGDWYTWLHRALTFLVVSCPCALVISVPLSFFGGIGGASRAGVLVKGGTGLELLAGCDTFVFDKTGTLTKGSFAVTEVSPRERREEIISAALIAESISNHPIARSVCALGEPQTDGWAISEISGKGMKAEKDGSVILAGNLRLLEEYSIPLPSAPCAGTVIYVVKNGELLGSITVSDQIKEDAPSALAALKAENCRTVMLTGDNPEAAARVAGQLGLTSYEAGLLPGEKVSRLEKLLDEPGRRAGVAFVGDGINDAPVLMRADLGIAMGGIGSDAAIEAADVVLMRDTLSSVVTARRIARKTVRIVRENIIFALSVKLAVLLLSGLGIITGMWLAVFADVGVAVIAILNAIRAMKAPNSAGR